ncbi:subclass B3 metallo-beta-lactamase [Janthinobacterium psychrotolerans]|uniref:Metallo-beta-lactamase class B n=1 Tax=Janthinobacterium psychrotolerans TaxID=1747903 RepID=A0A1A7C114_9BURK|nr:subclass B3 metallo-beta-lactamase [Janthinobacterium psychrotolerans]OBV39636.1 metallo-beta-lactamase class B [Janthinobacterium psychrotolerans]
MTKLAKLMVVVAMMAAAGTAQAHDAGVDCDNCKAWNAPAKPFNIHGNTWYVGVAGLSAVLVTSEGGHILLDGALPQSAPLIQANIESLGFSMKDVKLILNSHAHWDHAGGIAALARASGATVMASASSAKVLQSGTNGLDDPQYQAKPVVHVAKVEQVTVVKEGDVVKLGQLALTAHATPGHTPGGTTWTWTSCEDRRCVNIVYADSLNPYSSGDFRFTGNGRGKQNTPDISASFQASIAKVATLPCDIIIPVHPGTTGLLEKAAGRSSEHNPLIDSNGCRAYADEAGKLLAKRLASERG